MKNEANGRIPIDGHVRGGLLPFVTAELQLLIGILLTYEFEQIVEVVCHFFKVLFLVAKLTLRNVFSMFFHRLYNLRGLLCLL